jgi:hypothetical protein
MTDAAVLDLAVRNYQQVTLAERERLIAYLERLWQGMPDYFDATMADFVATVAPVMEGAQRQVAAATDAYLAQLETATIRTPARPIGVPAEATSTQTMRGVSPAELWRRPAKTVYRSLADGLDLVEAQRRGMVRLRSIAATDLQLAHTHAATYCMSRTATVRGYRRVTRGGISCALCLLASTQRYHKGDLMPIHPGCHCRVRAIHGDNDPGASIAPGQLGAVKAAIAQFTGGDGRLSPESYKQHLIVHQHGEIGPVLGVRGQSFTTPADLKAKVTT